MEDFPVITREIDLIDLGGRIRARRKALGFSQEKFALYTNIDRSYMGGIERGQRNVTFWMLCDLSSALGIDLGTLLSGLPSQIEPLKVSASLRRVDL